MSFQSDWQSAYTSVSENGASVTFSTASGATITGVAIKRTQGDLRVYEALGLVGSRSATLFFVRDVFDILPNILDRSVVWEGVPYTVRHVATVAPDGNCIAAYVTVTR